MASLDLDFLFTNIPVDKTIDIHLDNLYNGNKNPLKIPKYDFHKFHDFSLFWFSNQCSDFIKFHHEIDKLKSILHENNTVISGNTAFHTKYKISNFFYI